MWKTIKDAATCLHNKRVPTMCKIVITDGCVGNFICNGYEDGSRRHILGCIVKTLSKWISYDEALGNKGGKIIAQHEHHGVVTAKLIEQVVEKTSCNLGIPLNSIVTDDAEQCQRAKHIVSLRFPNKYFSKCYAHQVNLIVKDVLKILHVNVLERAKALVTTYNCSSTKWLVIPGDQCKKLYGQTSRLQRIINVCWNSTEASFASILRIRSALKMIDAAYGTAPDFPYSLHISKSFFEELSKAEKIVQPLTKASLYMQGDFNTLAHVINMFGIVYQSFGKISQSTELQGLLEKRWSQQEQPIFFLVFMFHPKYTVLFRIMACFGTKLSFNKMVQYSMLYYKKYIGDLTAQAASAMAKEVNNWFHDKVLDAQLIMSLPPIDFWINLQNESPLLLCLA
jgi:hypothetical protein